jgi:hypothetical protein
MLHHTLHCGRRYGSHYSRRSCRTRGLLLSPLLRLTRLYRLLLCNRLLHLLWCYRLLHRRILEKLPLVLRVLLWRRKRLLLLRHELRSRNPWWRRTVPHLRKIFIMSVNLVLRT